MFTTQTMRIAFIGQKGIPNVQGGVERYTQELAPRLAAKGHDVIVFVRAQFVPRSMKNFFGTRLVHTPSIPTKHLDAITHVFSSIVYLAIFERSVNTIILHGIGPSLLAWFARLVLPRAKVIGIFQSPDWLDPKWGFFSRIALQLGAWMCVRIPHETIAVAHSINAYIEHRFGKTLTYIPNGVTMPKQVDSRETLAHFGLEKQKYMIAVGRLIERKGFDTLIRAFRSIPTDVRLVIVGGKNPHDDFDKQLFALAKKDDRIVFAGQVQGVALASLYQEALAFVLPSHWEGLSLSILEARSYALPLIVSRVASNLEASGGFAATCIAKDEMTLRHALLSVLRDPAAAQEQAKRSRDAVERDYNWDSIADRMESILQKESKRGVATFSTATKVLDKKAR